MKRRTYPEQFERLWRALDTNYGEKGNKPKALAQFLSKEITEEDVDYILERYEYQLRIKETQRINGEFSPNFPHLERYLRDERFDDELSITEYKQGRLSKSDKADQALREYLTRSYGEGMEDATSDGQDSPRHRLN